MGIVVPWQRHYPHIRFERLKATAEYLNQGRNSNQVSPEDKSRKIEELAESKVCHFPPQNPFGLSGIALRPPR
jgi:hypothetical protein